MTALRRWHHASLLIALVGLMLASALVAVGAHEHDLWGGDTPEGIVCVVDHDSGVGSSRPSRGVEPPTLRAAKDPHRHPCLGAHGATHPPAVYRDLTPRPFDAASRVCAASATAPPELRADVVLPGPRGPPAA